MKLIRALTIPLVLALLLAPLFTGHVLAVTNTYTNNTAVTVPGPSGGCGLAGNSVTSTITVPDALTISDLNVALNITATFVGDVRVRLTSPGGTTIALVDQPGSPANGNCGFGSDNLITTLDDESGGGPVESGNPPTGPSYTPQEALSAFDGQNAAGVWTLTVVDASTGDTVRLNSWSLIVDGGNAPVAENDPVTITAGGAVTVPVTANDTDSDGTINPATVAIVTAPTCGTVVPDGTGGVLYTNTDTTCTTDTFTYTVQDNDAVLSNIASVLIGIDAPPPAPPAPVVVELPPPPPAPLCNDMDFDEDAVVRAWVPDVYRHAVYCHLIAENENYLFWYGSPLTHAGQVGVPSVLERGVIHAVDVFSPTGLAWYDGGAVVCLRGGGNLWFLPAAGVPRSAEDMTEYNVEEFAGFTCTTLYMPGTLVLSR